MCAGGVVDEQRRLHQIGRGARQSPPLVLIQIAGAEFLLIDARARAYHAGEQRFARHFEREDGNGLLLFRKHRHVLRDVQRERRFAHGGTRRQNHQLAFVQTAGHLIQLQEARAQAFDALAGIEKGVDAALEIVKNLLGIHQRVGVASVAQLEQALFGAGQDLVGLFLADDAAVDQIARSKDDAAQDSFVFDDADVALEVRERRQAFVERDQIGDAVHRFELVLLHQLVGDGDAIDAVAALVQLAHAEEDAAMLLQAEVFGFERARDLDVKRVVHENGAQDEAFGVEIGGEATFERDVRRRSCHKPTVLH